MDRDNRMAYLEGEQSKAIMSIWGPFQGKLIQPPKDGISFFEKGELASTEAKRLRAIEEDISGMRKREDGLVADDDRHEVEMSELRNT